MPHLLIILTCFTNLEKGPEYEHATPTTKSKKNLFMFLKDYTYAKYKWIYQWLKR